MLALVLACALLAQDALAEARRLAGVGRTDEAIALLVGDSPAELVLLAELLARSDRIPEAEAVLARAPAHSELAVTRASLLFELSRYDEARALLESVLETTDQPFAHYFLGSVLLRIGDPAGAARHARRAIPRLPAATDGETIPPRAEAQHLLGEASLRLGDDEAGEAALREALDLAPWHPGPAYLLGQHLIASGREGEGSRLLDRFSRARRAAAAVEVGLQLLGRDPEAARREFAEALRIFPGHPPATALLARTRP